MRVLLIAFIMETVPAPFWFVQFFKITGFVLHMIPMGIWFAGLPIVILCALWNCTRSRFFAERISRQLPIFMALGINFGIVPLLFLQTTYYKSFYTATILSAWFWIAVIPILIVGYYAVYIAAHSNKRQERMISFSIIASLCLIVIGLINTNGLTLMVRSGIWNDLLAATSHYGAALGIAHNFADPNLWLRFITMFGFGLITVGVWTVFDSHFLLKVNSGNVPEGYARWTTALALLLTFFGTALLTGTEFAVKSNSEPLLPLSAAYPYFGWPVLFAYLTFAVLLSAGISPKLFVGIAAVLQVLTLAVFGTLRQIGQNNGIALFDDVSKLPVAVQWDTLIVFLIIFFLGVGVIIWMVVQCIRFNSASCSNFSSNPHSESKS